MLGIGRIDILFCTERDLPIRHRSSSTSSKPINKNREEPPTTTSLNQPHITLDESRSNGPWKDRIRNSKLVKPPVTYRSIDAETYPGTAKAFSKASKTENVLDLLESDSEDLDYNLPLKSSKRSSLADSDNNRH
ncbi:hypothetical protein N7478_006067 [Penicillium angulare]|uniref:uncharacterized protein n=1 Tax=Penicillium angulare TaxID=116970 RepID=UPI002540621C|nr:uncharacterized protein N7478_006067 [Penicillium angulare]KAJ5280695.1 hypothetical protein N7478_006067 [Penicillium angulare]